MKLTFAKPFKHVGSQRFVLYGVADAEQHFFVEADAQGHVRRFYWLQFEHFLSGNTNTYGYQPVRTTRIGPLEFIHDTKLFSDYSSAMGSSKESDSEHMKDLFEREGLSLPTAVVRIRMFHLPGNDRRSELMIIYGEALEPSGLPSGTKGETPADEPFPSISSAILEHAKAGLKIEPL